MSDPLREAFGRTLRTVLRPLVHLLLKNGIEFSYFNAIAKEVFVEVASAEFGIRGRPTNMARVAAMTGLTRKQVRRIRQSWNDDVYLMDTIYSRPSRLIDLWSTREAYLDDAGAPAIIRFAGDAPSFTTLVREVGGDIPPKAMLTELIRGGAVEQQPDDRVKLISRAYVSAKFTPETIEVAGITLRDHIATIAHNLETPDLARKFIERRVYSNGIPPDAMEEFKQLVTSRSAALLVTLDAWLTERGYEDAEEKSTDDRAAGLGVYYFER